MRYKYLGKDVFLIRLDRGDRIKENIMKFCCDNKIEAGYFSGIGAGEMFDLAVYRKKIEGYKSKKIKGEYEITSLMGDVTLKEGKPFIHIHITLASDNMKSFGGHLNEGIITATGEIFFTVIKEAKIKRKLNEEVNIYLIDI